MRNTSCHLVITSQLVVIVWARSFCHTVHVTCHVSRVRLTCYHVHDVVERHLQRDVDHVVRVGGGQHVVAGGVVTQQVHRQLRQVCSKQVKVWVMQFCYLNIINDDRLNATKMQLQLYI